MQTFETSVDGVFSGGDVVTGAATAIEAIAAGRKAAHAIDTYLVKGKAEPEPWEFVSKKDSFRKVTAEDLPEGARHARREMPVLAPEERVRSFVEVEQGYSAADLKLETHRCLECGCTALFNCHLRRYATEYGVDIANFLGEATQYRVDRRHPVIDLDPNKCILCGRCVRMCSEVVGVAAYGFINRGFNTVVKPALGGGLLETECVTCGLCIGTCPTGAIAERVPLIKPGPWPTRPVPTVCGYCGVGCRLHHDVHGDLAGQDVATRRWTDRRQPLPQGPVRLPARAGSQAAATAWVRSGRELQETGLDDGISHVALRLKELRRKYTGDEIAVFVSPRLTNEEIYLAQKFARVALGTHQVASFSALVNRELCCPEIVSTAGYADLEDAQSIVVVNSALSEEHFTVDLMVKKAMRKGAKLISIGPRVDHTSRFADVHLHCEDGKQAKVVFALVKAAAEAGPLAGEENPRLAAALGASTLEGLRGQAGLEPRVCSAPPRRFSRRASSRLWWQTGTIAARGCAEDVRFFAEAAEAMGCGFLALREKANGQGVSDLGGDPAWLPGYIDTGDEAGLAMLEKEWCVSLRDLGGAGADLVARLRQKKIKVAVVLGEDPVGNESFPRDLCEGICAADFLVVGDEFLTATAQAGQRGPAALRPCGDERHADQPGAHGAAARAGGAARRRHRDLGAADPDRGADGLPVQDEVRLAGGDLRGDPPRRPRLPGGGGRQPGRGWIVAAIGDAPATGAVQLRSPGRRIDQSGGHPGARLPRGPVRRLVLRDDGSGEAGHGGGRAGGAAGELKRAPAPIAGIPGTPGRQSVSGGSDYPGVVVANPGRNRRAVASLLSLSQTSRFTSMN